MRMIEEVANMLDKMMLVEFVDDVSRKGVVVVDAVVVADNLMGSRVVVLMDALENQVFVVVVAEHHIHRNLA